MLLTSEHDLVAVLGVAAALLLALSLGVGILAALKTFQVRQFQDLLFKAERKIDTLERRMFNVLNAVPVALVETDGSGKFTFANKAAHMLLGRKDNELIGLRFHSATWGIAFPDGRAIPADMMPIARTLRGQTVKGFQHLIVNHGTHDKVLVSVTSMPIMNGNGEVIGTTSAMVEIESTAGEGVDDLTGLWRGHWFAAAAVPFWGLDTQGKVLDVNAAALDAFDLKRDDVLGKNWTQVFVSDSDFQHAIDYLGDSQDASNPNPTASMHLALKGADGTTLPSVVSAWAVRTHEGGEHGLTVMALKDDQPHLSAPPSEAPMPAPLASSLTDDDAQELEDLRNAEAALANLGVGVWQYDAEADTIVEDEGMRRLIGREYDGGPTLISDDDQARADVEFGRLLAGDSIALNMDIRVVHRDGREHWITLKGQSTRDADGERHVFGIAIDSTEFREAAEALAAAQQPTVVVPSEPEITQADLQTALEAARAEAHAEAMEIARKQYEAALEDARRAEAFAASQTPVVEPDVYGWSDAAAPVIIHEADPAIVAENEDLKSRLDSLQAELAQAGTVADDLRQQIASLEVRPEPVVAEPVAPEPVVVPDPAVVAENEDLKAHLKTLRAELADAVAASGALHRQIDDLQARPEPVAPEPETVVVPDPAVVAENEALKSRLENLQAELAEASAFTGTLHQQIEALHARPEPVAPEPVVQQVVVADPAAVAENAALAARLAAVHADLQTAETTRLTLQGQLDELAARPAPEPVTLPADTSAFDARIAALESQLKDTAEQKNELQLQLSEILMAPRMVETVDDRDTKITALSSERDTLAAELEAVRIQTESLQAEISAIIARPAPEPDTSEWDKKVAAAQFEMRKWQAAYDDATARLAAVPPAPTVDIDALTSRLEDLQASLSQSLAQQAELQQSLKVAQTQQSDMHNRVEQLNTALSNARKYETVGRLTGDVAQDFAQMLGVINGALEILSKQGGNEQVRRLSEAALAAGRRGERLTRQLQAFQSEDY